ncbi:HAMP domain-containing sensor histidine kinase [Pelagibius sp. Alg239-R121]|uniref:sensor histidine kinase n=1 Tax=Pelagibius sp. Alg239-R121 TaxID=2993448 RepID=UPI0024A65E1A|nr:HAMP domain-containing sensor histidine kinase [Pelagibius sp. Alg239-R121]
MKTRGAYKRSIAFRYTATFAGVFAVLAVLFAGTVFWLSQSFLRQQIDNTIEADASGLIEYYESGGLELLTDLLKTRLKRLSKDDAVYLLTDREFHPVMGNISEWPKGLPKDDQWADVDRGQNYPGDSDLRLLHRVLPDGHHLLVGRDTYQAEELEQRTVITLLIILVLTMTTGGVAGLFLHFNLRNRLRLVAETCGEIAEGNFSHRIPVTAVRDEIDAMSQTLNMMLDRVEQLMQGIRQVTNGIAHDLKTPLTRLRGQLEMLALEEPEEAKREKMGLALSEVDRLLSTFSALLRISRVESGDSLSEFVPIDLSAMLRDAVEFYEPIAEERGQGLVLQTERDIHLTGDRDLLFQSVANLIDNAIKYGGGGTAVTVSLSRHGTNAEITVSDHGDGIPEAELDRVFERFYRVENSRTRPGNGLGLSLVAAAVKLHKGTIRLENGNGLSVIVLLPLS